MKWRMLRAPPLKSSGPAAAGPCRLCVRVCAVRAHQEQRQAGGGATQGGQQDVHEPRAGGGIEPRSPVLEPVEIVLCCDEGAIGHCLLLMHLARSDPNSNPYA